MPPPGNTEPVQRALWEQPGDAGSISERGRSAAASSKAKVALQLMAERGMTEEVLLVGEFLCALGHGFSRIVSICFMLQRSSTW